MSKKQTTTAQSLPSGDMGTSVARPRRKADTVVKGSLHKWEGTDYAEFHPVKGKDEPTREMLKQVGNSTFYKNLGKKESSWSLHLNVDAKDCEDPVAALHEQFLFLTEGEAKQKPQLQEGFEGRMLLDNGMGLQIWLDRERGKVSILTTLDCGPNIDRQLLQAQSQMGVCISRNRQEILNHNKE